MTTIFYTTYTLFVMQVSSLGIGDGDARRFADFPAKELCEFERAHVESQSRPGTIYLAICVPSNPK
jgi:hypothetical protein